MLAIIGSYLTIIGFCLAIFSPVLVPGLVTAWHDYRDWRSANQKPQAVGTGIQPAAA
ncbi:hypothetical protein KQR54_11880 [Mycobacterium gordonae]|uniref:hypothetical protein n=1 Tax=Mycobacterium gordonae TaxID=1778 RepID=UPI001D55E366|nr:hypothetical protein [Mycobacterium gordonae]MBI2699633.1 hypothetical protein [Mycobacterium sp.]MCQ4361828.1 hypothetical protein [Mycobacterium gordonae]